MPRLAAILLAWAISFPLIAPLFSAARPGANLPACCRRDGKHGCAMRQSTPAGHGFSAQKAVCAQFPVAKGLVIQSPVLPAPILTVAPLAVPALTLAARMEIRYRIAFARTAQKRGPPSVA